MEPAEIGELVESMIVAQMVGDRESLIDMLMGLVSGPIRNALNVAMIFAGIIAEDLAGVRPEGGFHRVTVTHTGVDGVEREGSSRELEPHVATFAQMVAAIANSDTTMARDLFLGFAGKDGRRALALLAYGLNEAVHQNTPCATCDGVGDGMHDEEGAR